MGNNGEPERNATKAQLSAQEEPPEGEKEWGKIMINLCRDVQECTLPSWKFVCDNEGTGQSTFKQDFVPFPTGTPDRTVMRRFMKRLETHWEEARHQHLVSQYDDQYNRHGHNPQLPPLCKWHRHKLAWTPEKSDYPLCEPPTNDGLVEHLMKAWHRKEREVAQTVYHTSYPKPPASAYAPRQQPDTRRILEQSRKAPPSPNKAAGGTQET